MGPLRAVNPQISLRKVRVKRVMRVKSPVRGGNVTFIGLMSSFYLLCFCVPGVQGGTP
jgi:hypothetical protein